MWIELSLFWSSAINGSEPILLQGDAGVTVRIRATAQALFPGDESDSDGYWRGHGFMLLVAASLGATTLENYLAFSLQAENPGHHQLISLT